MNEVKNDGKDGFLLNDDKTNQVLSKLNENTEVNDEQTVTTIQEPINLEITSWEVHRYRKDKTRANGEWTYKGFTTFPKLNANQVIIENLTNDFEYRFTIKSVNIKGKSIESTPTNSCVVETELPDGWHRFYDKTSDRYYYANIKLGKVFIDHIY